MSRYDRFNFAGRRCFRGGVTTQLAAVLAGAVVWSWAQTGTTSVNHSIKPDAFSWLEEREGKRALEWVHSQNGRTLRELGKSPRFQRYYDLALAMARNAGVMPNASPAFSALHDGWVYDLSQSETRPRGLWRRARLESWRSATPEWHTVLDVDAFDRAEKRNWQPQGLGCLGPRSPRCMVAFSDGGNHTFSFREFDARKGELVPGGFEIPGAYAAAVAWKDQDTLLVATDFGPGTVSANHFPLTVRSWKRGQPLASAREIFRAASDDFKTWPLSYSDETGRSLLVVQQTHKTMTDTFWRVDATDRLTRMPLSPSCLVMALHSGEVIVRVDRDWTVGGQRIGAKSFVSIPVAEIGAPSHTVRIVKPGSGSPDAWPYAQATGGGLLISNYENGRTGLDRCTFAGGQWTCEPVALPEHGTTTLIMSEPATNSAFATYESFLQPKTLYEIDVSANRTAPVKGMPAQFDASRYMIEQLEAVSKDGIHVPYLVIRSKTLQYGARTPTLLEGYGAHGLSVVPRYVGNMGQLWLDQGGIYAVARIRGGSDFGSAWHVVKTQRQHTYEDFVAVAEDLIGRRVTSPHYLGIHGLSSGGLLIGVTITQHPELVNAAVAELPVLDLLRYDLLGSPSVAVDEFGSPDIPQERAFLEKTSPYEHLIKRKDWPVPFIVASTNDQEVYPGQPRRFAARMEALGLPFFYYENTGGGSHGMWSTPEQHARWDALFYTYLAVRLMDSAGSERGS